MGFNEMDRDEKMTQQKGLVEIAGSELVLQDVPGLAEAALGARPHDTGRCNRILL